MSTVEELRKAQEEGKRIVWQNADGEWMDCPKGGSWVFMCDVSRYKIVEPDASWRLFTSDRTQNPGERDTIVIQLTKSGINGKISAKVVE